MVKKPKFQIDLENIVKNFAGGFSSILALSLLVTSHSHIFTSFFKIFFMICVFGLYHGLIMLPVVLCILGPSDQENFDAKEGSKHSDEHSNFLAKEMNNSNIVDNRKLGNGEIKGEAIENKELEIFVPQTTQTNSDDKRKIQEEDRTGS